MIVYFNNSQRKNHAELYGNGAFFDLWATDVRVSHLSSGQQCIVATPDKHNEITFNWFSFKDEQTEEYQGQPCRVFYGTFVKSDIYSKAEAARREPYKTFFDKNGNFKRPAAIKK